MDASLSAKSRQPIEIRMAKHHFRVAFHQGNLIRQLARIMPVVVTFAKGNVLAATERHTLPRIAVHADITPAVNNTNKARVTPLCRKGYIQGIVRRAVFGNNQFDREWCFLAKHPFDRLGQEPPVLVRKHMDAYERLRFKQTWIADVNDVIDLADRTLCCHLRRLHKKLIPIGRGYGVRMRACNAG